MKKIVKSEYAVFLGAFVFAGATFFHPPLFNPWDTEFAFNMVADTEAWRLDHWVFLLGLSLWLIGLAHIADKQESVNGRSAARLLITSFGMWLIIISAEIAALPAAMDEAIFEKEAVYKAIWDMTFAWMLFAGYLAMAAAYIGIYMLSKTLNNRLRFWGWFSGLWGFLGVIFSLFFPQYAIFIQLATAPFPFLWSLCLVWPMLKQKS